VFCAFCGNNNAQHDLTAENRGNRYHLVTVKSARGFAAFCGRPAGMILANVFPVVALWIKSSCS
jgi:hypothetical protein